MGIYIFIGYICKGTCVCIRNFVLISSDLLASSAICSGASGWVGFGLAWERWGVIGGVATTEGQVRQRSVTAFCNIHSVFRVFSVFGHMVSYLAAPLSLPGVLARQCQTQTQSQNQSQLRVVSMGVRSAERGHLQAACLAYIWCTAAAVSVSVGVGARQELGMQPW